MWAPRRFRFQSVYYASSSAHHSLYIVRKTEISIIIHLCVGCGKLAQQVVEAESHRYVTVQRARLTFKKLTELYGYRAYFDSETTQQTLQ